MSVFPGTVQPPEAITAELRAHFRYPEDLFRLQRDRWPSTTSTIRGSSSPTTPSGRCPVTRPPTHPDRSRRTTCSSATRHRGNPSFRLASAMVGFNREFLSAYISVHSDPESYGRIEMLQLPTDTQTQGPQQTQNSMISDTRVASERTLLERSNRIQYGNLLTLPIADGGFLYVEPLFTERLEQHARTVPPSRSWHGSWSATANPAPAGSGSGTRPPWPRPSTRCSARARAAPRPHRAATPAAAPPPGAATRAAGHRDRPAGPDPGRTADRRGRGTEQRTGRPARGPAIRRLHGLRRRTRPAPTGRRRVPGRGRHPQLRADRGFRPGRAGIREPFSEYGRVSDRAKMSRVARSPDVRRGSRRKPSPTRNAALSPVLAVESGVRRVVSGVVGWRGEGHQMISRVPAATADRIWARSIVAHRLPQSISKHTD